MITLGNIKKEFPIFSRHTGLVYLDNASTTQKPACVLDVERKFYENDNANVHRGVYGLAERADAVFQEARSIVAKFVGADTEDIIFTKNATESANMIAFGIGESLVEAGDNIVVTELEHHANYLPWQEMASRKGLELRVLPVDPQTGMLDINILEGLVDKRTRVVAVTQMSNVLGTRPDIQKIVELAHLKGALVVMDSAQGIVHIPTSFAGLGVDAAFFTGHKLYAPMGTGVLYLRKELADKIPPLLTGGGMVLELPNQWLTSPQKFEAGTPNVAGLAGLAEAISFLTVIGTDKIAEHESKLAKQCIKVLSGIPEVEVFTSPAQSMQSCIVSFVVEGVHPHDLASILAEDNICIRAGHHCAKPLLGRLGKNALARVSFGIYNNEEEIELLKKSVLRAINTFK